jgi:hypothetical protein
LPSASASSVTTTVFSLAELSKSTAVLMFRAHSVRSPCASISCTAVFAAAIGHENYCSRWCAGLHRFPNAC